MEYSGVVANLSVMQTRDCCWLFLRFISISLWFYKGCDQTQETVFLMSLKPFLTSGSAMSTHWRFDHNCEMCVYDRWPCHPEWSISDHLFTYMGTARD